MANGEVLKFQYPEVVADNFIHREEVDSHNELSHDGRTKYQNWFGYCMGNYLLDHQSFYFGNVNFP